MSCMNFYRKKNRVELPVFKLFIQKGCNNQNDFFLTKCVLTEQVDKKRKQHGILISEKCRIKAVLF